MDADIDLQVWLEATVAARSSVIVPYVRSDRPVPLQYTITTRQHSRSGGTTIGQSGEVFLQAGSATALSRLAIRRQADDICHISVTLSGPGDFQNSYRFDCPEMSTNGPIWSQKPG